MTRAGRAVWWPSGPLSGWVFVAAAAAAAVLLPFVALAFGAARGSDGLWQHVLAYVLPAAARDTLVLLVGVGLLATVVGTGAAWLVTAWDFPGRSVLDWALLLPLAVPTYIVAYAYLDVLHPVGAVQAALRAVLGFDTPRDFRLPDIRSMAGGVLLLGFVLYPYVYLTTRAMFLMQSANLLEAARTLGASRAGVFVRVALPLARPAVAIGLSLVLMETLNDIGASEFLGIQTMTVAVYTTWITRSDLPGAAQIALAMLAIVVGLVLFERYARRQRRYVSDPKHPRPLQPRRLRGLAAFAAFGIGALPVCIGFVVPASYLLHATAVRLEHAGIAPSLAREAFNTTLLSVVATGLALAGGIAVVYAVRVSGSRLAAALARTASLGYAVPGTVLAIGLLPVVTGADAALDSVLGAMTGLSPGLLLLGSGAALVYAYFVRFLALTIGGVEAGFSRVSPSLDGAARTLGETAAGTLWRVHLPLTRPAVASAAVLVFVDCMKELPSTLLLRPLGVETLATHLYGEAIRGTYEDAAVAALLIVLVGLLPVALLARLSRAGVQSLAPEIGEPMVR